MRPRKRTVPEPHLRGAAQSPFACARRYPLPRQRRRLTAVLCREGCGGADDRDDGAVVIHDLVLAILDDLAGACRHLKGQVFARNLNAVLHDAAEPLICVKSRFRIRVIRGIPKSRAAAGLRPTSRQSESWENPMPTGMTRRSVSSSASREPSSRFSSGCVLRYFDALSYPYTSPPRLWLRLIRRTSDCQ